MADRFLRYVSGRCYEMEMRALVRLAAPLLARMGRRQLAGDYPKLKQRLERAA